MTDTGHIIGGPVDPDYDGAVLTADLAIGDTVLHVDDTADFDEDAAERDARVIVGLEFDSGDLDSATGTPLAYSTCDDDAGTVTLSAASTTTASSGDRVYIEDPVSGYPVGRLEVLVSIDGGDSTGDALPASLDVALLESIGNVDLTDLAVELEEDEDGQLLVSGFPGLTRRQGALKFDQDETTAVGAGGTVTLDLKYIPVENSEHLYVGGVYQRGAVWTRDLWTVSIPDEESRLRAGVKVAMEYAYTDPAQKPPVVYSAPVSHARAGTWNSYSSSFITSQALPSGTQVGDILIAVAVGNGGGGPTISDSRMTSLVGDSSFAIAVGYASDLSDLTCHVGGSGFALDQFAGIEVLSVRGDGSGPLAYDPGRIVVSGVIAPGASIGSVSGSGHGVIAAIAAAYGNPISIDMGTDMPDYTDWGGEEGTAVLGHFGYCATEPPPSQTNPTNANAVVAMIGLK